MKMLPIYEAIDVIEVISEKAGHTKPWVVSANTPDGIKLFVTKLYTTSQVDQLHCVSKEVICNLLAREFDLNAPPCALIEIPEYLSGLRFLTRTIDRSRSCSTSCRTSCSTSQCMEKY